MAQRNPLNERYQGDGPGGQTRKSAARAKPVTQAAASVHVKKKPQTDSEKRAARKAREKEEERRAAEKARKKAERAKAEGAESAAEDVRDARSAQGAKGTTGATGITGTKGTKATTTIKSATPVEEKPKGFLGKLLAPAPNMPSSEEYRKWRRRYWILIGAGVFFLAISFAVQTLGIGSSTFWMISIGCAYVPIIAAFVVDFRKVKPLIKEHQKHGSGNKSPKQLNHEQEAKERAEALEVARKAEREARKKGRRRKKPSDTIVPGDAPGDE